LREVPPFLRSCHICAEALTLYPDTHVQDINYLVTTEANKMAIAVSHV